MCSTNNGNSVETTPESSYLFSFDFDHTVVHDNSDTYIFKLLEGGVPQHIKDFLDGTNWTEYMNKIFKHMHEKKITVEDICACVRGMEPTKGMLQLLTTLVTLKSQSPKRKIDILIISDANNLFITEFLTARVLDPLPKNKNTEYPFHIITNKSSVSFSSNNNVSQPLSIEPYCLQTKCQLCPKNLCKGAALSKFMESKGPYTRVFYTGDGWNDVCPALKLNQHDYVFPRKEYKLWKKIQNSSDKLGISAQVVEWDDAEIIKRVVEKCLEV